MSTALLEVLEELVPASAAAQTLLVIDECHMLSDTHKRELFKWLQVRHGWCLTYYFLLHNGRLLGCAFSKCVVFDPHERFSGGLG